MNTIISEMLVTNTREVPEMDFFGSNIDYVYERMNLMYHKEHQRILMTYFPAEEFLHYIFFKQQVTAKEKNNYHEILSPYVDKNIINIGILHLELMRSVEPDIKSQMLQRMMLNEETLLKMCYIVCLYQYLTKMNFMTFLEYEKYLVLTQIDLEKAQGYKEVMMRVGKRLSELKLDYDSRQKKNDKNLYKKVEIEDIEDTSSIMCEFNSAVSTSLGIRDRPLVPPIFTPSKFLTYSYNVVIDLLVQYDTKIIFKIYGINKYAYNRCIDAYVTSERNIASIKLNFNKKGFNYNDALSALKNSIKYIHNTVQALMRFTSFSKLKSESGMLYLLIAHSRFKGVAAYVTIARRRSFGTYHMCVKCYMKVMEVLDRDEDMYFVLDNPRRNQSVYRSNYKSRYRRKGLFRNFFEVIDDNDSEDVYSSEEDWRRPLSDSYEALPDISGFYCYERGKFYDYEMKYNVFDVVISTRFPFGARDNLVFHKMRERYRLAWKRNEEIIKLKYSEREF